MRTDSLRQQASLHRVHRMPFGAECLADGSVRFRLWAPAVEQVAVATVTADGERLHPMDALADGWFQLVVPDVGSGARYAFRLPDGTTVPDPASRRQPEGVHGPSEVVDPEAFDWLDGDWRGRPFHEAVVYELHVGTFTAAGTFAAAAARFGELANLGVTAIELMPVAETPGARNWGYDGVHLFAPSARYGSPEDLKRLVQAAHACGLMVLLDVVYNHFGPEGNYLQRVAPQFFTSGHRTPWGDAIDFDGPRARTVRDFFIHNALHWLEEYHLDGLRLDAAHAIHDRSRPDVLEELAETVHARLGASRHVHLVVENDDNAGRLLARAGDGHPRWYVAQWNDDFHHAMHVLLTGERHGYYADYADDPLARLGRALAEGFAYQGEPSPHRGGRPRGTPSDALPPTAFVNFLQNHDQVGNRPFGERLATLVGLPPLRAAVAVLLLAPSPPLLFMGEDWGAATPFPFFCDFGGALAAAVRDGRRAECRALIGALGLPDREPPDPGAASTFSSAVLRWEEAAAPAHARWRRLHRRLLALRHREIVPRLAAGGGRSGTFMVIGDGGLVVSWRLGDGTHLTLVANLGTRTEAITAPPGRCLFATARPLPDRIRGGVLPPWSVAWYLATGVQRSAAA